MNSNHAGFVGGSRTRVHYTSNVGVGKERAGRYSRREGNPRDGHKVSRSNDKMVSQDERLAKIKSRLTQKLEMREPKPLPDDLLKFQAPIEPLPLPLPLAPKEPMCGNRYICPLTCTTVVPAVFMIHALALAAAQK